MVLVALNGKITLLITFVVQIKFSFVFLVVIYFFFNPFMYLFILKIDNLMKICQKN